MTDDAYFYNTGTNMIGKEATTPGSPEEENRTLFKELTAKQKPKKERTPSVVPEVPEDVESRDLPSLPSVTDEIMTRESKPKSEEREFEEF